MKVNIPRLDKKRQKAKEHKEDKGTTMLEFALGVCLIVLVGLMGIPSLEASVKEQVSSGRNLWSNCDFRIEKTGSYVQQQ